VVIPECECQRAPSIVGQKHRTIFQAAATILQHVREPQIRLRPREIRLGDRRRKQFGFQFHERGHGRARPPLIHHGDLHSSGHKRVIKNQIVRLDQIFQKLGEKPQGVKCPAIDGLISEADELAGEVADKEVLDAAIIGAAQSVEHYEMARYGTLIAWAESLGHDDIIRLLNTNLKEEKAADKKLSTVALRKGVNRKAAS